MVGGVTLKTLKASIRMKRSASAIILLLCHQADGFSIRPNAGFSVTNKIGSSSLFQEPKLSSNEVVKSSAKRQLSMKRIKSIGGLIKERSDTMRSAGFYGDKNGLEPLTAGYKTNISVFVACMLYKWYRSIFINKVRTVLICEIHVF